MGDYGGPIAQDWMWREEISWDAIENSNGANRFLARGPYRAITRWHVLTIFQPLNPSSPSLPLLFFQKQTYWCWGSLAALCLTLSISLCRRLKSLPHLLSLSAAVDVPKYFKRGKKNAHEHSVMFLLKSFLKANVTVGSKKLFLLTGTFDSSLQAVRILPHWDWFMIHHVRN